MKNALRCSRLLRDTSGNTAIITAFALTALVGTAGLGTDSIQWTLWKRQLQREADSAALAGALANYQGSGGTDAANTEIGRYNLITLTGTPVVEIGPSKGPYAGDPKAVRVVVQSAKALPFSSLFLKTPPTVTAEATAAAVGFGNYCVVALENTATTGVTFQGSASLDMGCGVATNSQGSSAVNAGGSSSVQASPIAAVGGIPASNNYASGTALQPYSSAQADPFAGLPTPVVPGGCNKQVNVSPNQTATVKNPTGVACFSNIDIKGTVTFDPGVYYIDAGQFSAGSQSVISGDGVTFILTSSTASTNPSSVATLNMNGGATINLTASRTGTYAGVLFYQDRRASSGTDIVNGNSSSAFQGSFYFPSQQLQFNGTSGMTTNCLQLIARDVTFIGNTSISNVCPPDAGTPTITGVHIRLVS
jgi:Flp pilus assembly protein TadG